MFLKLVFVYVKKRKDLQNENHIEFNFPPGISVAVRFQLEDGFLNGLSALRGGTTARLLVYVSIVFISTDL